jgi:hypothetical protein
MDPTMQRVYSGAASGKGAVMSVFVSPDRLMGRHFETGLASLKAAAEG